MLYFDNNATTLVPQEVIDTAVKWVNVGNPSADHAGGRAAQKLMQQFRELLGQVFGVDPCCRPRIETQPAIQEHMSLRDSLAAATMDAATHVVPGWDSENPNKYKIIFCSGASEGNAMIVQSVVASARKYRGGTPHVIASAVEHKSVLATLEILAQRGDATYTLVPPRVSGHVAPEDVAEVIRPETCLACVMHANNETGAINDIRAIAEVCHAANIPFHCDMVQTAGRIPPNMTALSVDSAVISFHKFHGFPGAGAIILKQQLILGYHLTPIIPGTQNDGLRGGTENIVGIAAGYAALKYSMADRRAKNARILECKQRILVGLAKHFTLRKYARYVEETAGFSETGSSQASAPGAIQLVVISPPDNCLVNTILMSVVRRAPPKICNQKIKRALEAKKCIVSVGSACNTSSASASHVLYALGADEFVRAGALRVSLGDSVTLEDADRFVRVFVEVVREHTKK